MAAAGLAAWLYRSERARDRVRQLLSSAPAPLRQTTQAVASAVAERAAQTVDAVAGSSLPQPVKGTASRAATAVRSAAVRVAAPSTAGGRTATLSVQELADGSWVGDANWSGRTFHDAAAEAEVTVRRLAAHLGALPEADRPDGVRVARVSRAGGREEHEQGLTDLLGP